MTPEEHARLWVTHDYAKAARQDARTNKGTLDELLAMAQEQQFMIDDVSWKLDMLFEHLGVDPGHSSMSTLEKFHAIRDSIKAVGEGTDPS